MVVYALGQLFPASNLIPPTPGIDFAANLTITGIQVTVRIRITYFTRKCVADCWELAFGIPPWKITSTKWGPWSNIKYHTHELVVPSNDVSTGGSSPITTTTPDDPLLQMYVGDHVQDVMNELSVDFDRQAVMEEHLPAVSCD